MNLIGMVSELIIRPKLIRLNVWEIKQESLSVVLQGLLGAPRVYGGLVEITFPWHFLNPNNAEFQEKLKGIYDYSVSPKLIELEFF